MFLTDGASQSPILQPPSVIVADLVKLIQSCDSTALASLEKIIDVLMKDKDSALDDSFVHAVWKAIQVIIVNYILYLSLGNDVFCGKRLLHFLVRYALCHDYFIILFDL